MTYKLKRVNLLREVEDFLKRPYNKPKIRSAEDEKAFCDEYEVYDNAVRSALSKFGRVSAFSGTEFSMGDPWGGSRKIGIVLGTDNVIKEAVIAQLWRAIHDMPVSYLLVLSGDVATRYFYIFIDKDDEILGYSPDPKVLDAFGFPPAGRGAMG